MTRILKMMLIIISIPVILLITGKYMLDFLFEGMCGNDMKQTISSPNGEKVAYVFERSCGATTGISLQLSILDQNDDFENKSGNTFRSDTTFSIEWVDEKDLQVIYDKSSEIFEMDKKVNGVRIIYVGK